MDAHSQKILEVKRIVKLRNKAKHVDLDFDRADSLREKLLKDFGVEVIDQKNGPSGWRFKDGSSNKLPAGTTVPKEFIDTTEPKITYGKRNREETATDQRSGKKSKKGDSDSNSKKNKNKNKSNINESQNTELNRNRALLSSLSSPSNNSCRSVQGVMIEDLSIPSSSGHVAQHGDRLKVHYIGRLQNTGKVFDSSLKRPFVFRLGRGEVIRGWEIGFNGMPVGAKRKLTIPPEKAYGRQGSPPVIPSNATLVFEVTLLGIIK